MHDTTVPHAVLAATFVAAVAVTLGWHTRIMSVLLYLGMLSLYHRNVSANGGPDAAPMITAFYLMLCPSGAAYSMDAAHAARKRGTPADALIVPWGVRLLQIQLCLLYFQSCVIKCDGVSWMKGTVVHYILFNQEFRQFDFEWLAQYPLLINFMTHGAASDRIRAGILALVPTNPAWVMLAGALLHLCIRPVLNVPGFGETLVATYLTFLAADEVDALLAFIDPRLAGQNGALQSGGSALGPARPSTSRSARLAPARLALRTRRGRRPIRADAGAVKVW